MRVQRESVTKGLPEREGTAHVLKELRAMQEGAVVVFASGVIVVRTGESWEVTVPDNA